MIRFAKSISKEEIETALNTSESVGVAALSMGIDKRTFVKAAKQYGIYFAKGINDT